MSIELTRVETQKLIQQCKEEKVSVNSALVVAFLGAQKAYQDKKSFNPEVAIAGNIRRYLKEIPDTAFGMYAGGVSLKFKYNVKKSFWDNVRAFHKKVQTKYKPKFFLQQAVPFEFLDPTIFETRNFKALGSLVLSTSPRYSKISEFSQRDDVPLSLFKRSKVHSTDVTLSGTAITNLTKLPFSAKYGDLELERLMFYPSGAFPLVTVNLVIGAVTCSDRMTLVLDYAEEAISPELVTQIKNHALRNFGI
ncbi:MAG: hypothetical protein ACTSWL_08445 [Promethearchaeota archaeon]